MSERKADNMNRHPMDSLHITSMIFLAAMTLFIPLSARGDESHKYDQQAFRCIGIYGGEIGEPVAVRNNVALFAQGHILRTLDISGPNHPREGGFLRFSQDILYAHVNGPALYLIVDRDENGLKIVDISQPLSPRLVEEIPDYGFDLHSSLRGRFLLVSESTKLAHFYELYDVHDPFRLDLVAAGDPRSDRATRTSFITDGHQLYIAHQAVEAHGDEDYRYQIIDWNTSHSLGMLAIPQDNLPLQFYLDNGVLSVGGSNTTQTMTLQKVKPGQVFWNQDDNLDESGAESSGSDTNNIPAVPLTRNKDPKPNASEQAVSAFWKSLQYMPKVDSIKVADGKGYASDGEGTLTILDLVDPTHPKGIGRIRCPGLAGVGAVEDNLVFDANPEKKTLRVIDCANLTSPTLIGTYQGELGPMVSSGSRLYVATEAGLQILDVSQPSHIKPIGSFPTEEKCTSVATSGTLVYLFANELYIVDAKQAEAPRLVSRMAIKLDEDAPSAIEEDERTGIKKLGNYIFPYYFSQDTGISCASFNVVDVSNPAAPRQVKQDDSKITSSGVPVAGRKAALPAPVQYPGWLLGVPDGYRTTFDRSRGMRVYDLTNPVRPRSIGYFHELEERPVVLYKNLLYLADGENGLLILKSTGYKEKSKE